ncbi:CPK34 [Symbiodinium natans]|uniref:CPK34 protein n=1 Tax=Symbiodinium natans TaxID=878477 RepID=A0A812TU29_9DINO|nr:CPK34 [Symbiodinium natans]
MPGNQELLQDRFKISRDHILGEGSYAVVYKGLDRKGLKNVAVKLYKDIDEDATQSFKKSIDVLLSIQTGKRSASKTAPSEDGKSDASDTEPPDGPDEIDTDWAENSTDWAEFATRSFDPRMVDVPSHVRRRSSRGELIRKIDFSSCFVSVVSFSKDEHDNPGLDSESESLFIVFELGGESLEDRLVRYAEEGRKLSADEHRSLQWALVSIVFGLHTLGYVHLDIKPANIVSFDVGDRKEQWKLIDLDGALCSGKPTLLKDCVTTLQYTSPELAGTFLSMQVCAHDKFGRPRRGKEDPDNQLIKLSRLMDVWSVGMCAMEAIFLVPILMPWYDEWLSETGTEEKFLKWLADYYTEPIITGDLQAALQEIDKDMCSFLEGMLQKDPAKRFSIIECINHTWFQKIRHSHLEDLAGILERSEAAGSETESPTASRPAEQKEDEEAKPDRSPAGGKPDVRRASRACALM